MNKDTDELEKKHGLSAQQLNTWEEAFARGEMPGKSTGEIVVGRPLMFGRTLKLVAFKEPEDKIAAIDQRAKELGMRRSDYLRHLVDKDLELAGVL